jgi:hypothetical protein
MPKVDLTDLDAELQTLERFAQRVDRIRGPKKKFKKKRDKRRGQKRRRSQFGRKS